MPIELNDKVALITGGAQGIGLGIARKFLGAGAKVAITDIDPENLDKTAESLKAEFGDNLHPIVSDISLAQDVEKMVAETLKRFGTIDILVNNAGTGTIGRLWEMPVEEWDRVLNTNLRGGFLCTGAVVRFMIDKGVKGRIINISSVNGSTPTTGMSAYCSSKAGFSMFTQVAALELGPYGINVNAIAPGYVTTALSEAMLSIPTFEEAALERSPLGRYGKPEDIAKVALLLASEYADWITGQVINADGGTALLGLPKYYEELSKAGVI